MDEPILSKPEPQTASLYAKKPDDFKMVSMRLPLAFYDRIKADGLKPRKVFEIGMLYKDEYVLLKRKADLLGDENQMLRRKVLELERGATLHDAVAMQKSIVNLQGITMRQQEQLVKKQEELELLYEQLATMRALKEVAKGYARKAEAGASHDDEKKEESEAGDDGGQDTEGRADA